MAPAPLTAPFLLLRAFTSSPDSGNPAAVVFLPSPVISYPSEKLQAIATNLNQPITAFVSALPGTAAEVNTDEDTGAQADFSIRWFTVSVEIPLCGHGTLAAAKAIFATPDWAAQVNGKSKPNGRANGNAEGEENLLRFQTITGSIVSACKTTFTLPKTASEVEQIQISFPHAPTVPIVPASPAAAKVRSTLGKALKKPAGEVNITYMGHGEGSFKDYLLIELGKGETLQDREIVKDAFVCDLFLSNWHLLKMYWTG
jgi:Phenazine biosynthesis-like protein